MKKTAIFLVLIAWFGLAPGSRAGPPPNQGVTPNTQIPAGNPVGGNVVPAPVTAPKPAPGLNAEKRQATEKSLFFTLLGLGGFLIVLWVFARRYFLEE